MLLCNQLSIAICIDLKVNFNIFISCALLFHVSLIHATAGKVIIFSLVNLATIYQQWSPFSWKPETIFMVMG